MNMNSNLPKGFENRPEKGLNQYKKDSSKPNGPGGMGFRGRPGGGPGRGMGQAVEHAENVGGTLTRLLQYFKLALKLCNSLLKLAYFLRYGVGDVYLIEVVDTSAILAHHSCRDAHCGAVFGNILKHDCVCRNL